MVDVDAAKHDKYREEDKRSTELPPCARKTEAQICERIDYRCDSLDYHIARRYLGLAEAAFSAEYQPTEYRKHIKPFQPVSAAETMRRLSDKRLLQRRAKYHDVQKAADNRAKDEHQNTINDFKHCHFCDPFHLR